jgi:hypothetical protein
MLAVLLAVSLTGCSFGHADTTDPTPTIDITTTTVHYVPHYVTVGGHRVLMPTEEHHEPIEAYSNFGQNVVITDEGFEPSELYAQSRTPIVFTNLTDRTQVIVFYHFFSSANHRTKPIPPGETFSFSTRFAINLVYSNPAKTSTGHLHIGGCPPDCNVNN